MRAVSAIITTITLSHVQGFNLFGLNHNFLFRDIENYPRNVSTVFDDEIEQPFDNFDRSETRTWKMRYFKKLDLWKPGGPIIIYIGGEAPFMGAILEWSSTLHYRLAEETNGALYATVHRYYGASKLMPEPVDYRFLSSQQALADIARLIQFIKSDPKLKASKVVMVGGSYAGNLAAWMRLRYPELVDAAVSSSGPVLAKKDFYEYVDVVHDVLNQYGPGCIRKIDKNVERYTELLKTSKGIENLKHELNICQDNDMTIKENQELLFLHFVFGSYYDLVQTGTPDIVRQECETNELYKQDTSHFWNTTEGCLYVDIEQYIQALSQSGWNPWLYQTCTEFGFYQTTDSEKRPFVHWSPVNFFIKLCTKAFGEQFNEKRVDDGVANTNRMYGGITPKVSRVVFVHGGMDPWHALGVQHDLSDEAPARIVKGTSHCAVLAESPTEPKELTKVRHFVKTLIKKWISSP